MDVPAPLQVEFQQSSLYVWMVPQIQFIDECFNLLFYDGVNSQCKLCITVEIPQVVFLVLMCRCENNDWCRVVTVLITVKVPQLQYFDQVDDVPVVHVVVGVSQLLDMVIDMPVLVHVVFVVLKTVEIRSCSTLTRWSMSSSCSSSMFWTSL